MSAGLSAKIAKEVGGRDTIVGKARGKAGVNDMLESFRSFDGLGSLKDMASGDFTLSDKFASLCLHWVDCLRCCIGGLNKKMGKKEVDQEDSSALSLAESGRWWDLKGRP